MKRVRAWLVLLAADVMVSGCVTPPAAIEAQRHPPTTDAAPVLATPALALAALEQRHRERALAYAGERNWADALIQWELLALLKPESQEYREAAAAARKRVAAATAGLARAAEFARRQGNLDQATLLYLRVLYLDRDDAAAAQALREIDAERTQRAYLNRPPRGNM